MPIRSHLRLLVAARLSGLLIFAAVAFMALIQIEVNGPIYQRISLSQNVVSDYVPPSESLLQAALICNMMENATDQAQLRRYVDQFQEAQHAFETQFANYGRRMPEGKLKDLMRGTAYTSAEQYLQIAQDSFIPLVLMGDHQGAQQVLISRMKPLYEQHAAAVDEIVEVASHEARDGEILAAREVRRYTVMMVAVGLAVLFIGGFLSIAIAHGISRQTEELKTSFGNLRALGARLENIREEERKRVAREIHDQLGQALTAIKLDVRSLIQEVPEILEKKDRKSVV